MKIMDFEVENCDKITFCCLKEGQCEDPVGSSG